MSIIPKLLLSLLLCLSLPMEVMAEDVSVESADGITDEEDASPENVDSESATDGEGCVDEEEPCLTPGAEATALPPSGSLPLEDLNTSVEEGEEEFGGCHAALFSHGPPGFLLALILLCIRFSGSRREA